VNLIRRFFGHLNTINRHKWLVMKHCFRVGLYRQGLMHDLSKYAPAEFLVGVKYYQGNRSPNSAEREIVGYSSAWLRHKGRNKHHLEYWIDYSIDPNKTMVGCEMPVKYVVEMFCDRVAASKNYNKGKYKDSFPYEYYLNSKEHYIVNEKTGELLGSLLKMLSEKGESYTFDYIKRELLNKS